MTILGHNVKNLPKRPGSAKLETFKNQFSEAELRNLG